MLKCIECSHRFVRGDMTWIGSGYICIECEIKENKVTYRGDNYHFCLECKHSVNFGDIVIQGKWGYICEQCSKRENMETKNLEITVKLNGKEVPLNTISTETFEMMKILEEKPKEIPVARVGNFRNFPQDKRLFLKITNSIRLQVANRSIDVIAINLQSGCVNNTWRNDKEANGLRLYENVKSL